MCSVAPRCLTQSFGMIFPGICWREEEPNPARAVWEPLPSGAALWKELNRCQRAVPGSGSSYNLGLLNEAQVPQPLPPNIWKMWRLRARVTIQAGLWALAMLLGCSCCSPAALLWVCSWPRWLQCSGLLREGWEYCREQSRGLFCFKDRCLQSQDLSSCCTCLADASRRNPALHFPLDVRLHF